MATPITLNAGQQRVFDYIVENGDRNIVVNAEAGTGKGVLMRKVFHHYASDERETIWVLALTNIAANNSSDIGGMTIHRKMRLPIGRKIPWKKDNTRTINQNKYTQSYNPPNGMTRPTLIIIDEVYTISATLFEMMDLALRKINFPVTTPFGGTRVIAFGDMRQMAPVFNYQEEVRRCQEMNEGNRHNKSTKSEEILPLPETYNFKCKQLPYGSSTWTNLRFDSFTLDVVMRQTDPLFLRILRNMRHGELTDEDRTELGKAWDGLTGNTEREKERNLPSNTIYIVSTNKKADEINESFLESLPGDPVLFKARDYVKMEKGSNIPDDLEDDQAEPSFKFMGNMDENDKSDYVKEICKSVERDCPIPMWQHFKVGCRFISTMNVGSGPLFCNGHMGDIVDVKENEYIDVKFDHKKGETTRVHVQKWEYKHYVQVFDPSKKRIVNTEETVAYRIGIPGKNGKAITVHKSQGLEFDSVCCKPDDWAPNQCYVKCSRAKTLSGLYFCDAYKIRNHIDEEIAKKDTEMLDGCRKRMREEDAENEKNGKRIHGLGLQDFLDLINDREESDSDDF